MKLTRQGLTRDIIQAGKRLSERGYVEALDGNISARVDSKTVIITASGTPKGSLRSGDIVAVRRDGRPLATTADPSSEVQLHLALYDADDDIRAVVHAHPPYATAFAASGVGLTPGVFPEVVLAFGDIPLVRYEMPSSRELGELVAHHVSRAKGALLANHGAVTWASGVLEAEFLMEKLEHAARVEWYARALGGPKPLTGEQVDRLKRTHPLSGNRRTWPGSA